MTGPLNLAGWADLARGAMEPGAFAYVTGGAGDEISLRGNRAAFDRLQLLPRMLRAADRPDTSTTVLGERIAAPVMVAPMAYQACVHPEGDLNVAAAAAAAGLGMCLSSLSNHAVDAVADAGPGGLRWFQLYPYRDDAMTAEVIALARESGYRALVVTVDVPTYGIRERDIASAFAIPPHLGLPSVPVPDARGPITPGEVSDLLKLDLGWPDIERYAATSGLPVLVKGILRPDDAARAVAAGAAGVVVSNHGGRQLDTVIATIDALGAVVEAVADGGEVLLDSGVRRGTDVVKALALGARAVLIGRPVAWANGAAGRDGVAAALAQIVHEIANAMTLCGCGRIEEITADLVRAG